MGEFIKQKTKILSWPIGTQRKHQKNRIQSSESARGEDDQSISAPAFWNKRLETPGLFLELSDPTKPSREEMWAGSQRSLAPLQGSCFQKANHHYNTPTIWGLVSRKTLVLSKRHPKPHLEFEKAPKGDCEKPDFSGLWGPKCHFLALTPGADQHLPSSTLFSLTRLLARTQL